MLIKLTQHAGRINIHFDTHSDLNQTDSAHLLRQKYLDYVKENNTSADAAAQRQVSDIGAALSGVLLATGIRNVIWVLPK